MPLQSLPTSAELYGAEQRREIGAAVAAIGRIWGRMGEDFDISFRSVGADLLTITDGAQKRIALGAQEYIPAVLEETGQRRALATRFDADVLSLVGTAGDGREVASLLSESTIVAKTAVKGGATAAEALAHAGMWLSTAVGTLLSDTGRSAERLGSMSRPVTGWVRMLEPPSCGRCVILAGKRERSSTAFRRHPRCDCRSIPASESIAGDLTVDPKAYFDSLDEAGQIKMMGSKANAEAVREYGADIRQVINAYRKTGDVRVAQVYGRSVKYTT